MTDMQPNTLIEAKESPRARPQDIKTYKRDYYAAVTSILAGLRERFLRMGRPIGLELFHKYFMKCGSECSACDEDDSSRTCHSIRT